MVEADTAKTHTKTLKGAMHPRFAKDPLFARISETPKTDVLSKTHNRQRGEERKASLGRRDGCGLTVCDG